MKKRAIKWMTWYMVMAMFILGVTPRVHAGLSPSEAMTVSQVDRTADLNKIQKVLELKMISERLRQLGFSEEGIQQRLNQLSDEQIHRLALKLDELKVGGNGAEVVIAVFVIAILVVILIYLLGHQIVVKKG
ncbi:MAG: PA2779 family protein [Thermodesulfobacteriota bacterium]|nr:PA2779 family protein [Thermodesulfobacteriota bacterium]